MPGNNPYTDRFKRNDDVFRNTMESIFQKYSSLNDPGIDVCFKTMTCRTQRGSVPIDSAAGKRVLENLKLRVNANHSFREDFEDQENDQMELSGISEDDLAYSDQKENDESLWHGGDVLQQSMNGINSSHSSLLGVISQPEEDDEELEKTLSSHGSTLLDVYPSMLNQIGEAYRRQHVTDTAKAVLQKYRRKQWHAGVSNPHVTSLKNRTLNKTTEMSFTNQSPVQENIRKRTKDGGTFQNKLKPSPLKNASYEASACFYSPRRDNANVSGVSNESPMTELHLDRKPRLNTARVIDFSTLPHSVSPLLGDKSPDLNQTYDIEPAVMSASAIPASLVSICPQQTWYSPGGTAKGSSLMEQRRMSLTARPFDLQSSHISLDKDGFRDHLNSSVLSLKRGFSCLSPSRNSIFKPVTMEKQQSTAVQSSMRKSPPHRQIHSEIATSSPQRSLYHHPEHQQGFSTAQMQFQASPRLSKHQCSLPGPVSACSSSRSHVDLEFRKLYHHFICHGTSSPCSSSRCHVCEKQLKTTSQSTGFSSSSMSALALTPLKLALKKRRRQPEVEESLRFKRFRESCSPVKHIQRLPHQVKSEFVAPDVADPGKDRHTWERAILLQCPSPQFLRGTGNLRRIREAKLAMQLNQSASPWRDVSSGVHLVKVESPLRSFNRGMPPLSPSLSRRRLQYGLLQ